MNDSEVAIRPAGELPQSPYLAARRPTHVLIAHTRVPAALGTVFDFFSRPENLGEITPPELAFEIETALPVAMGPGAIIDYTIRLGPLQMKWRTEIEVWEPGRRFVDVQTRGPYACWWHEHAFEADGAATSLTDRVYFRVPFGPLGAAARALFVAPKLARIFGYRGEVIRRRFGGALTPRAARPSPASRRA